MISCWLWRYRRSSTTQQKYPSTSQASQIEMSSKVYQWSIAGTRVYRIAEVASWDEFTVTGRITTN
jgi:hypothetical protein